MGLVSLPKSISKLTYSDMLGGALYMIINYQTVFVTCKIFNNPIFFYL